MLRHLLIAILLLLPVLARAQAVAVGVEELRELPVLESGRIKPLDTLARDTVRFVTGRESFGTIIEKPDGTQAVTDAVEPLRVLLDWCHPLRPAEETPLVYVPHLEVRKILGMTAAQKWIAPGELRADGAFQQRAGEIDGRLRKAEAEGELVKLTGLEEAIREVKLRLDYYDAASKLTMVGIVPLPHSAGPDQRWAALSQFVDGPVEGEVAREIRHGWDQVMEGYHTDNQAMFDDGLATLKQALFRFAGGPYADQSALQREVFYNHLHPFRIAWIAYLISLAALIFSVLVQRPITYRLALGLFFLAIGINIYGFILRCRVTGWAPVTNMYESVIWVALVSAVMAAILELIYRGRTIAIGGAVVATIACVVADIMPATLGRQIGPLTAVLRSNLWLTIHVLTIVSSYAAFALAMVLGNIALFQFMRRAPFMAPESGGGKREGAMNGTLQFTYRSIQVGVLLVAAGTILGGLWADVSWGRFWGWDPKEVWALIVLLVYLALLHGRYAGWIGPFGLAAGAVLCFTAVIMSWYGVNFILGTGLHSYGFGAGGQTYVFPAVFLQCLYVAGARFVYKRHLSGVVGDAGRASHARAPGSVVNVGE